jgi:hypothetical protein
VNLTGDARRRLAARHAWECRTWAGCDGDFMARYWEPVWEAWGQGWPWYGYLYTSQTASHRPYYDD